MSPPAAFAAWDALRRQALAAPGRPAIVEGATTTSYRSLAASCAAMAGHLHAGGVAPGVRVALPVANRARDVARLLALAALGAEVLVLEAGAPAGEAEHVLDLFRADCVVTAAGPVAGRRRRRRPAPTASSRRFALVTSGVNGAPKVVRRDWPTSLANAAAFARAARYRPGDGILVTTPLHHSYAFSAALLAGLVSGAALHLVPAPAGPSSLAAALADARVTVVQSVPFLYHRMLDVGFRAGPARLRACITAGEPCAGSLRERWAAATGLPLWDHYGTTEAAMVTLDPEGAGRDAGRPLAGVRVRALDEVTGEAVPPGTSGELAVRLRGRASVYCGHPEPRPRGVARGWARTGDVGRVEPDGRVVVESRLRRRIDVAGNDVDPVEVERALLAHPAVRECAVVGRSGKAGQEVWAFVVAGEELAPSPVRRFLAARLRGHQLPRHLVQVPALPRTAAGRVRLGVLSRAAGAAS